MKPYLLHITLFDLAFLVIIITGINFSLLLWLNKRTYNPANKYLALALIVVVLWTAHILATDIGLVAIFPFLACIPLRFSLAFGPLIYFYVLKLTRPAYKLRVMHLLHFGPVLVELSAQLIFQRLNPVLPVLAFFSVISYLYLSYRLIENFYRRLKFIDGDRYHNELRWLQCLLVIFGILWLLWIPYTIINYFGYHGQSSANAFYLLILVLAIMVIWTGAVAFLRPDVELPAYASFVSKPSAPAALRQKGAWLKRAMEANRFYRNAELSLSSLAEKLEIHPHELSRIINIALKKNFNDFVNEYRVKEVARKMQDPAYSHITLLGIAYESGFNSQSSFTRIFKLMTGKTPLEYKIALKKESSSYNLGSQYQLAPVILSHETTPKWHDDKLNRNYMFKNYLKNAWRHILRHKTYSTINVIGLSLGICGCLVIYLIASFEFSFDTFHPDKERIYCVDIRMAGTTDPNRAHWNSVPVPMPEAMRSEMSGLEKVAAFRIYKPEVKIKAGDTVIKKFDKAEGIIVQPDYFDILRYTWLSGSKKTSLNNPMTVVLTQNRAKTYFGNLAPEQMIGKTLIYQDSLTVTVTGILKDWDKNSDFNFSDFISFSTIKSSFLKRQLVSTWDMQSGDSQMLIKLPVGVNPLQIDAQFPTFIKKHIDPQRNPRLHAQLQSFTGIHFHQEYGGWWGSKADLRVLYILSAVAVFILVIAAINFINLSTAQSIQRTKDIGILKVLGLGRRGILFQFLTETFILALLAVAIAVIAVKPLLNLFAAYIPHGATFYFTDYGTWLFLIGIAIFTTLLAGLYPAKLLSAFKPAASLKGGTSDRAGDNGYLRKSLIVFQFTVSLIFIVGTIAINKQINYMINIDLGVKTSNIITLRTLFHDQTGKMKVLAESIKHLAGIEQVITESMPPMGRMHWANPIQLQGSNEKYIDAYTYSGGESFIPFYQMKIIAGRNLFHSDSATEYLINVTAATTMGFRDPKQAIGRRLNYGARNKAYPIVGVVADFYEQSLNEPLKPCVIANFSEMPQGIALKLNHAEYQRGDIATLVDNIAVQWKKLYPEEPFDYAYLGDSIAKLYENEQQTQWLMKTATFITIFISCMGLFGLAMFTTERRSKEISIRKVLGASVTNILTMLNKEVVVLIAISLLIASPIAWLFIHKWLQSFAYRTNLSLWIFIIAGSSATLIALVTISLRTIRSATADPVKGLRNE